MRNKDQNWDPELYKAFTWENVPIYLLMDIRDELKQLNALLSCSRFLGIPTTLNRIARNTTKRKRK